MFAGASGALKAHYCSPAIGCSAMSGQIAEEERGYEMQRYLESIFSHEKSLKNKDTG